MNVPYRIPLAVSTDGIAVHLGIQEPQSIDLSMSVGVYAQVGNLQTKEKAYTPTTTPQTDTITADEGFDGIDTVNVSIDAVQAGAMMLAESYDVSPEIEINNAGKITARHNGTGSIAPVTDSGWIDAGGNVTLYFYGECEKQLPTQSATTITPTESAQTAVTSGKYTTGAVDVAGIPSNYVGSDVPLRDSSNLTASGATVTAPAGYYENPASKSVDTMQLPATVSSTYSGTKKADIAYSVGSGSKYLVIDTGYNTARQYYKLAQVPQGTEGTPTATKGAVNNHSVSVTPKVTNTTGYITGGTKTGSAVTVSAAELVSGDKSITSAGTEDVSTYETVTVPAAGFRSMLTPSIMSHSISVDANGEVSSDVVIYGSDTPVYQNGWATDTDSVEMYNQSGQNYQLPTQGGITVTPNDTQQTIVPAGKFTTGDIKVDPIPRTVNDFLGRDAEFVGNIHSHDYVLSSTGYNSWTPSTTAASIVAAQSLTAFAGDLANYEYCIRWLFDADIKYNSGTTQKAIILREVEEVWQVIAKRPSSLANIGANNFNGNNCSTYFTAALMDYYNTSGTRTFTWSASYGLYLSMTAAAFSNSTSDTPNITVKTPAIYARCSNTYFSTARAANVDKANSKMAIKGELYRVKKDYSPSRIMFGHAVYLYNNSIIS